MFHLTPGEIAGFGMLGTLLGTLLGARLNARNEREVSTAMIESQRSVAASTLNAQSRLSADERLWNERKLIYLDILDDVERRSEFRLSIDGEEGESEYAPTPEQWRNLNVRTSAFGSVDVQALLAAGRRRHLLWIKAVRKLRDVDESFEPAAGPGASSRTDLERQVVTVLAEAGTADRELIARIRHELQGSG